MRHQFPKLKRKLYAGSNPATLTNIMQEKLFKLLMLIEGFLPKKIKQKLLDYLLKREMKKIIPLKQKEIKSPFQKHIDVMESLKLSVLKDGKTLFLERPDNKQETTLLPNDPEIKKGLEILKDLLER